MDLFGCRTTDHSKELRQQRQRLPDDGTCGVPKLIG